VSFLVAAKEEESNIAACLASMVSQDYPRLEVIAVNDRSADRTGAIMDELAARHANLRAVHVRELPQGWLGKNNAMRTGLAHASGEWLCFTDADCVQISPRSLRVAMNHALETGSEFLSVLPAHETHGLWERVIQPACSGIMMIWFNPLRVNNPRRSTAYANGAFMLMTRECYEALGGHDAVKTEFNEDMKMAQLAKRVGRRLRVVSNDDLYTVRMYQSLRQTWNGWSRIFYGCFGTWPRLVATAALVVTFSLLPWAALVTTAAARLVTGASTATGQSAPWSGWNLFAWLSAFCCFAQATVMLRFYRLNKTSPWYGLLYPIGAVVGLGALVNAMGRLRKRSTITWRGTTYTAATATAPIPASANPVQ
jgi:glycosyltransferase involved in cell wall biosynthesis